MGKLPAITVEDLKIPACSLSQERTYAFPFPLLFPHGTCLLTSKGPRDTQYPGVVGSGSSSSQPLTPSLRPSPLSDFPEN